MNKQEQAQQLRLAAEILETGHPWEYQECGNWFSSSQYPLTTPAHCVAHQQKIHLALATPPDGRPLHNHHSLTAEQVGAGWRLLLPEEVDGRFVNGRDKCEWWSDGREWRSTDQEFEHNCSIDTIRVPLSVPWPEAPKPKPTTKTVPLGPEDVPPGSVLQKHGDGTYYTPLCVSTPDDGVYLHDTQPFKESYKALSEDWQINRSIPLTGKWDSAAWEPCHKTLANG